MSVCVGGGGDQGWGLAASSGASRQQLCARDATAPHRAAVLCCCVAVAVCACRTVKVPTIDGRAELVVPPLTLSGEVLRMAGKGVEHQRTGQRGSQLVTIR